MSSRSRIQVHVIEVGTWFDDENRELLMRVKATATMPGADCMEGASVIVEGGYNAVAYALMTRHETSLIFAALKKAARTMFAQQFSRGYERPSDVARSARIGRYSNRHAMKKEAMNVRPVRNSKA